MVSGASVLFRAHVPPFRINPPNPKRPLPSFISFPPIKSSKGSGSPSPFVESDEKHPAAPMTITPSVRISDRKLSINGRTILSGVPDAVVSASAAAAGPVDGVFLGAQFPHPSSRHVLPLGLLRDVRFMASFRFKLWWMSQKMGTRGSEIPLETQFLLVESTPNGEFHETMYVVFLPLVEGSFRACLQGNPRDELELCLESGDPTTASAAFSRAIFVGAASGDPFAAVSGAVSAVKSHLKTFRLRTEKQIPGIVSYFGWCTWDAFYQDVTQSCVESGLQSLTDGGVPPKFIIIDDGWQSVALDRQFDGEESPNQCMFRLAGIKENSKFQSGDEGIKMMVETAKEKYGLKFVYVWHSITGYWGGVQPGEYGSRVKYPMISPGVAGNEPWMMKDPLTVQGIGLVNPKSVYRFYNEYHKYLSEAGIDGVKVDVQCVLETLGSGLGGRVELTQKYHMALDASVAKNFPDNGCIACMSHNTDALYCAKQTGIVRASDDFYPRDPMSHTIHIASVAYNSLFLGEFMLPDWDMFHSLHPAAEYHASARAISGGPVYVSDAPGKHDFELLRKLVLPDGTVLRARLPGRPTRDCLFSDPSCDGKSLLKIWNMNLYTGVLGVYNCQGAAWCSMEKKNMFHQTGANALSCAVKGSDVHLISEAAADPDWNGDCAIYRHSDGELVVLPHNAAMPVSLKVLEHEIFLVSPIKALAPEFRFAPFGLVDMFNAGGAIVGLKYEIQGGAKTVELHDGLASELNRALPQFSENRSCDAVALVSMEVKGCGRLGAYSSSKPRKCLLGSAHLEFSYDPSSGFLSLQLEGMPDGDQKVHRVVMEF